MRVRTERVRADHGARGRRWRARSRSSTASASIRAPGRARSTCACRRRASLDVTREIDVIEEIARIYGLEHVPVAALGRARGGGLTAAQRVRRTVADALPRRRPDRGADALLRARRHRPTASASPPDDPRARTMLAVANPLSQEHSHLRTLLLPSLLEALARNAAWGRDDLALFEIAHTYHPRRRASSCRASRGRSAPSCAGAWAAPPGGARASRPRSSSARACSSRSSAPSA